MAATKIVLHSVSGEPQGLEALVEAFLRDGVKFVGVVGKNAARIEDLIDEAVIGDGSDESRFLLTASHEGESLAEALEFARVLSDEYRGETLVLEV